MNGKHDPYCRSYYPALTDPDTCTWCYVIRQVRLDEYFKGWDEGFGIGYGEGREMSTNEYNGYKSLNKDIEENIDIAYWQGYNNAMVENSGVEEYKASLLKNIKNLEQVFSVVGDYNRAQAYEDIIYLIENFD